MKYPKLLLISYNSLKYEQCNGRTLINLVQNWDKDKIAQIYMSNDYPNYENCSKYFRITDNDLLCSLIGKKNGKSVNVEKNIDKECKGSNIYNWTLKKRKNYLARYIRVFLWNLGFWKNNEFNKFIDDFDPDVILIFSGLNTFIDKIAFDIQKKKNIPVIMYNCEDEYFHKSSNDYFQKIFRNYFKRKFEDTMKKIQGVIYNCHKLKKTYNDVFKDSNSIVIYNPSTSFDVLNKNSGNECKNICYLGSLNRFRIESFITIADTLGEMGLKLNLYGKFPNKEFKEKITANSNIIYHGLIPYDEVKKVMTTSRLLIDCLCFEKQYIENSRHGFSTKIGDTLGSGTPFFVYGPIESAETEYLIENQCAFVCTEKEKLKDTLNEAIYNNELRSLYVNKALEVNRDNHNLERNSIKVLNYINEIINSY